MSTTIDVETATRRILWAEDEPKDIDGLHEYLRYRGHTVVGAPDFESTAAALEDEPFDLLVVDQRMPRYGRKSDDAGARLVTMLAAGEFGQLNIDVPFVFVTASADWVLECGINVEELSAFLGIEEKGDDVLGPLERYLDEVPARAEGFEREARDHGPRGATPSAAPAVQPSLLTEQWLGVVIDTDEHSFRARLTAAAASAPDYEATLPRGVISARDQERIIEGSGFTWSLRVEEDREGQRTTVSSIRFMEIPVVSDDEIAQALDRARARRRERGLPDA